MKSLMKGVKKRLSHTEGDLKDTKDIAAAASASPLPTPPTSTTTLNGVAPSNSAPLPQPAMHSSVPSSSSSASATSTLPLSSSSSDLSHLPRCRLSRSVTRDVIIHNLPALRDAPPSSRKALLLKKLRLCCFIFSFDDAQLDSAQEQKEKELKRSTLLELVNYLTVFKPSFHDDELAAIFDMVHINLFRPLPPSTFELSGVYNPEEDEPSSEPSWVHLQVLYEFLLRLATSTETDAKLMDKYFTRKFILSLLELFDSEDPRERDYLKTILHRIYGNFMSLRPFIRRAINNVFYRFIYETDRHNGIAELLEILGSIINGFALPLKEQHKQFLIRVLLPLHKVTHVSIFHPQLSYCFPASSTRILTDRGLQFLDEIEARLHAGDRVLYACYDRKADSLVYRPGRLVVPPPPERLVEFCSPHEAERWGEESDEYGVQLHDDSSSTSEEEQEQREATWVEDVDPNFIDDGEVGAMERVGSSQRLALHVTPAHRMYVRTGSDAYHIVSASSLLPSAPTSFSPAPLMPLTQHSEHDSELVSMLACAENGHAAPSHASERSDVQSRLRLDPSQFPVFLELLGFWLGCGHLRPRFISFAHVKEASLTWLEEALKQVGLRSADIVRVDTDRQQTTFHVTSPRWCKYFEDEFGLSEAQSPRLDDRRHSASITRRRQSSFSSLSASYSVEAGDLLDISEEDEGDEDERSTTLDGPYFMKRFPRWALMELARDELRLVIRGLWRADGRRTERDSRCGKVLFTSDVIFRDQLVHALLHCGWSPSPVLAYRAGSIRGYTRRSQARHDALYSRKEVESLCSSAQRDYRPVRAAKDAWAVWWADSSSASGQAACRPSALRRSGIRELSYASERDGRVWCAEVDHPDHLIVAQRARRVRGVVTQQSRPVVTGNCVTQFLEKDQTLAPAIISAILKFWPLSASKKELMFLNELEEVLDRIQSQHLGSSEVALFARLAECINSPHFQVSERAIYILNNDIMVRFVQGKKELLVPILARRLIGNTGWSDEAEAEHVQALVDQTMERCRTQAAAAPSTTTTSSAAASSSAPSLPSSSSSSPSTVSAIPPTVLSPLLLSPHRLHLGHASAGRPGHWNATIIELTSDIIKVLSEMEGGSGVVERMMEEREAEVEERVKRGEERVRRWQELSTARLQWEEDRHSGKGRGDGRLGEGGVAGGLAVAEGAGAGGAGTGAMEH